MNTLDFIRAFPSLSRRVLAAVVAWDREVRNATNTGRRTADHDRMERAAADLAAAWKIVQDKAADAFLSAFRTGRIAADAWTYGASADNEAALAAVGLREGFDLEGKPGADETWRYRGIVGRTVTGFSPSSAAIVADLLGADFAFADARGAVERMLPPASPGPSIVPTGGGGGGGGGSPRAGGGVVSPAPAAPLVQGGGGGGGGGVVPGGGGVLLLLIGVGVLLALAGK